MFISLENGIMVNLSNVEKIVPRSEFGVHCIDLHMASELIPCRADSATELKSIMDSLKSKLEIVRIPH